MLDLHCHILPGVDDGPTTLDEALAMARFCAADGITHITATPHCNPAIRLLRADVLPHVARFNAELARTAVPLTILPGSEIQVTSSEAYRRDFEAGRYCHLGGGNAFTLFELPWNARRCPPDAAELVGWLRERGTTPIIAHPERQPYLREGHDLLRDLVDRGAWIQVTVDSLLGNHGEGPREAAEELLREYPDAVLATDAHNPRRCSGLKAGFAWARERLGERREAELRARADEVLARLLAG